VSSVPLGVLVARDEASPAWMIDRWRAIGVLLDPPAIETSPLSFQHAKPVHAATLPLVLDCRKAMDYSVNLANGVPSVYVVLRDRARRDNWPEVRLISASPFEVQPYLGNGIETVDRVPMPSRLVDLVRQIITLGTTAAPLAGGTGSNLDLSAGTR
jgi:hypothetical protein